MNSDLKKSLLGSKVKGFLEQHGTTIKWIHRTLKSHFLIMVDTGMPSKNGNSQTFYIGSVALL